MARPRKIVLMYCAHEGEKSIRRFVIEQQCRPCGGGGKYRVIAVSSQDELMRALVLYDADFFDCVLIFGTGDPFAAALAVDLEKAYPVVFVECVKERDRPAEWLPRLDIACALKRGPKASNDDKTPALHELHRKAQVFCAAGRTPDRRKPVEAADPRLVQAAAL